MATAPDASGAICESSAQSLANWVKCAGERALAAPPPSHSPQLTTNRSSSLMSCSHSSGIKKHDDLITQVEHRTRCVMS
ncbi:MAG: hypothetical protein NZM04_05625 [Methylacidiphilales bacterium]|nr:hypothetical protein [Candidatus Methylacidiphilales bacterium]